MYQCILIFNSTNILNLCGDVKLSLNPICFFFRFSFVVVVNAQVKRLSMGSIQSYLFFFSLSHSFHSFAFLSVIFWKQTLSVYFLFLLQHHVFFFGCCLLLILTFFLPRTSCQDLEMRDEKQKSYKKQKQKQDL